MRCVVCMRQTVCVCATFYPLLCDLPCISREEGEYRDSSSLIFPLGHFDGWINNARMKARRLYHYIENNWVQSKLMITGKPSQKFHQNLLLLLLPMINNNAATVFCGKIHKNVRMKKMSTFFFSISAG